MQASKMRTLRKGRMRLSARGLIRSEVLGRDGDRDLIQKLARCLAEDGTDAERLRSDVTQSVAEAPPRRGGVLAALRRSPLVGAGLDLTRPRVAARNVQLPDRVALVDTMKKFRGHLPANFKFDRDKVNGR